MSTKYSVNHTISTREQLQTNCDHSKLDAAISTSSTLALSTEHSFPRLFRAISNAKRAMRSIWCKNNICKKQKIIVLGIIDTYNKAGKWLQTLGRKRVYSFRGKIEM